MSERLGDVGRGRAAEERALELDAASPDVLFQLACLSAIRGDAATAMDRLESAVAAGFTDVLEMKSHPDLEPLRSEPAFTSLMETMIR